MGIGFTGGGQVNTQAEIADGADESDGRWQTLYAGGLTTAAPNRVTTGGSGAVPTFGSSGAVMFSGTSGDNGHIIAGRYGRDRLAGSVVGTHLVKVRYLSQVAIGSLGDVHAIGYAATGNNPGGANDVAVFRPTVGDSTTGNVRVDNGGTDTDGSLNYPAIDAARDYTVLIDDAGTYLTAGHTGFYVDGDPRAGDTPDVDLAATPGHGTRNDFGVFYSSNGNSDRLKPDYLEVAIRV